jgi:Domain of unknown function (DUF4436)
MNHPRTTFVRSSVVAARFLLGIAAIAVVIVSILASGYILDNNSSVGEFEPSNPVAPATNGKPYDAHVELSINQVETSPRRLQASGALEFDSTMRKVVTSMQESDVELQLYVTGGFLYDRTVAQRPVQVPLKSMSATLRVDLPSFDMPLYGYPTSYPYDTYLSQFRIHVLVPEGVELSAGRDGGPESRDLAVVVKQVELEGPLSDWSMIQDWDASSSGVSTFNDASDLVPNLDSDVEIAIERSPSTLAFIYAILALPILITLGYILAMYNRSRTEPAATMGSIELAAALLAIITLRQVLVPSEISGITTLDNILGIEIAIISAISVLVHVLPKGRQPS